MNHKCIMLQGTGSSVGKSLLTAALCRIFKEDGYRPVPFKSQNMALNSYITAEGHEMGRAQVVQAEACGLLPSAQMNPILLKPTTDKKAQVILQGKVYKNMSAVDYHEFKPQLRKLVQDVYQKLEAEHDIVVIEGAGSPAEINLRDKDLVNMGMAEIADAPVLLIGDIDKGGVFASILGTIMLLTEEERKRVKGVIINKFRGDVEILKPGLVMLEDLIKISVVGVIPYLDVNIDDEDSVSEELYRRDKEKEGDLKIEIVCLPHISNFTDFNVLHNFPDVAVRYVQRGEALGDPDILIIPGSKNTIEDLLYLREKGLDQQIIDLHKQGRLILGICGGYQMLGRELFDPEHTESNRGHVQGLGLLDMETTFATEKVTTQTEAQVMQEDLPFAEGLGQYKLTGYEIHMGVNSYGPGAHPFLEIVQRLDKQEKVIDGVTNAEGNVWGTYLHGIFDNTAFTRQLLNNVRKKKGLAPITEIPESYREFKEKEYDRLAQHVRAHLDMPWLYSILKGEEAK